MTGCPRPAWPAEADELIDTDRAAAWACVRSAGRVVLRAGTQGGHTDGPVFTRADDVAAALANPALRRSTPLARISSDDLAGAELADPGRDLLNVAMRPPNARRWAAAFRPALAYLVDIVADRGRCEAVNDICGPAVSVLNWIIFGAGRGHMGPNGATHLWGAIQDRRRAPGGDLVSQLMHLAPQLTDEEIYILAEFVASPVLGVGQVFGYALFELATDPALARKLCETPSSIPVFVEEIARLEPTTSCPARVAVSGTRIGDVDVSAGERIMLAIGAANREAAGGDQVNTRVRKHWAWGAGRYRCLGNHLARAVLCVMVETWLERIPEFTVPPGVLPAGGSGQGDRFWRFVELPLTWAA